MFRNSFERVREVIVNIVTSRLTVLLLAFLVLGGILIYRLFDLQIIHGQEYLDDFLLQSKKTKEISATRGKVYDRNGNLLAYDDLAYSVKLEDVYETTGRSKNQQLNANIYRLIQIIEKNGDEVINDFGITIDENGEYAFSSTSETRRLRFLADIYGHKYTTDLKEAQRTATPDEVMDYMAGASRYAIGDYQEEGNTKSDFIPGKGYTKEEVLKMVTIRYAMSLTSYQKYVGTTVASDVSERTVAAVMENMDVLDGVSIEEDTVRRYVDSIYFSHVLGYTGKITTDELESLNAKDLENGGDGTRYSRNDTVGKIGIESYMEEMLQGTKGMETVFVNNTGKVMSVLEEESRDAVAGSDVYLTIDKDLTIAVYNILEQKLAGILVSNIRNIKTYVNENDGKPLIPFYDVYYALFNNQVIDVNRFTMEYASDTEKEVYQTYLNYKEKTYAKLREELTEKLTPYKKLSEEYQVYQSNIVSLLTGKGILDSSKVDSTDQTYIAWTKEETISLKEYLSYAISQGWVDVTKIDLNSQYADSETIYSQVVDCIFEVLDGNSEFQKKLYKYMILSDEITGRQICYILCEQGQVEIDEGDVDKLYAGQITPYQFMLNRISNLEITPAQLALDPCTGSVVITDVNTGEVLALVSYPGYDNNKMSDSQYNAKLSVDKSQPQWNHATQQLTAPGSTYKMVSSTASLMEGFIDLTSKINCLGVFETVSPSPKCWIYPRGRHGAISVSEAIQKSCNYFFYEIGYRMSTTSGTYQAQDGLDILNSYADLYGLTEKSGIEIVESSPQVATEYPIQAAIGQANNSFTTVGLARYVTAVANSGTCYNLTLLDRVTDAEGNTLIRYEPDVRNVIDMPQGYWDAIHLGMRQVVENKTYFSDLAVNVAGKTGTAQESQSRPDHALFVGYAPYEEPEIAIATRIAFGYTSDYAAQTTRDIVKYYYGLAQEQDIITGVADELDDAAFNND